MTAAEHDVAIIGAGPAGLTAALKSALLFHSAVVIDKGKRTSRAFFAPQMNNIPGYPRGVSGKQIMEDLRAQIGHAEEVAGSRFVTYEEPVLITTAQRTDDGIFHLRGHRVIGRNGQGESFETTARAVVIATGVVDQQPYIRDAAADYSIKAILPYANKGLADYCLLCDGHTIKGKRVAVLGLGRGAAAIAKDLRDHFGARETVLVTCVKCVMKEHDHERHETLIADIVEQNLPVIDKTIQRLEGLKEDRIRLVFDDDSIEEFDKAWISYGWYKLNNELAVQLGAQLDDDGYVRTNEDTVALDTDGEPLPGLFVIGDLRAETWNQIPIAMGDAETAIITAYAEHL